MTMLIKALEIRDEGTCIPVFAIRMFSGNPVFKSYLRRNGYPADGSSIAVLKVSDMRGTNDPYEWVDLRMGPRTMPTAHQYILDNFDTLNDGDVIDVRVILGEAHTPAVREAS